MSDYRFPFGRPVEPVAPTADGPRRVFVLGVYPSAVHARWVHPDGSVAVKDLAIDNEPEPFWWGDDAADRVAAVTVPDGVGHLEASDKNGPSGKALDSLYLVPLGLGRQDCWITDLENCWKANEGQLAALERAYTPLVDRGLVPAFNLDPRPSKIRLVADRSPSLREEWDTAAPEVLITLGNEPADALDLERPAHQGYGTPTSVRVWDREVLHLALVHPRQAGGLGDHSGEWAQTHGRWIDSGPLLT